MQRDVRPLRGRAPRGGHPILQTRVQEDVVRDLKVLARLRGITVGDVISLYCQGHLGGVSKTIKDILREELSQ